ncbi:MAG: type I restriction enzyme EcoAI R protein [Nitrospiraceae bacterium]|nr:MAG: type I restriction enzyme EcoAI R protein [Nitrospiraceae bacterium]
MEPITAVGNQRREFEMTTEADTCRKYVLPKLYAAGWTDDQISEQRTFTDGRIIVAGTTVRRGPQKRADYLLRFRPNLMLAVVEAKASHKNPGDGLQQAKEYAQILDLKFAYSTNGHGIVEYDFLTGKESKLNEFPSPDQLWARLRPHLGLRGDEAIQRFLAPSLPVPGKPLRYYQEIAVNRVVRAILSGQRRVLVNMATGTGKTDVAFHMCWKLWSSRWNRTGESRKPRILYLSDRSVLVDDPKDKQFAPFGDARWKIQGEAVKSREMYFATYQAIARDERRPGLYREYSPEFFDLVIVDECHRGSARDESNWREILEYFAPAYQLGMTATPLREENRDTYAYFGSPVYTYSLRQGIDDGFLAPYRVHRIVTDVDATGWRPSKDELDRYGRPIPDEEYQTPDFERIVALRARTQAIARNIAGFLKSSDPYAKTIVFCVDQEHAEEMRRAINNECADLARTHPDYVVRVVADEGDIGRGHLSRFQELETRTPVVVTTSKLLTTGVDAPTCKNIGIARVINSMTEFKQIIGRGTRVRADYGKLWFSILDYTGSATRLFADPDFDGDPIEEPTETPLDQPIPPPSEPYPEAVEGHAPMAREPSDEPILRKYYVDGGSVEIAAHVVYELDASGRQLRVVKFTDYAADKVRSLWTSAAELRNHWVEAEGRAAVIESLEERGITLEQLAENVGQPEADPFDLLCFVAWSAPLRTRRERAERLRKGRRDFFERFQPEAREILQEILDKYIEHGTAQFKMPDILKVPPIDRHGNVVEIVRKFGDAEALRAALEEMQNLLYEEAA